MLPNKTQKAQPQEVACPAMPQETVSFSTGPLQITTTLPTEKPWPPFEVKVQHEATPASVTPCTPDDPDEADGDGPGVGGGYIPAYSLASSADLGDGLLWHTSDRPMQTSSIAPWDDGDGPGVGGGYVARPFQATTAGVLFEEFVPPDDGTVKSTGDSPKAPEAEGPSAFQGVGHLQRLQAKFSADPVALQRLELKAVEHYEEEFAEVKTPAQFQSHTLRLRELAQKGASLEELRPQAYALARRAAHESLGMRPYDSQMLGALSMDAGTISQMGTGEGKTLTALMPLYLNALTGQGSHLITVNDYLAQAGHDDLKEAFETLGMSVGLVLKDMSLEEKRKGYAADITYLSNDTLGFDYLHDRTVKNPEDRVQRPPHFALIDEVDQVLLDEARVPLIIAGPQPSDEFEESLREGKVFSEIVRDLVPGEDFRIDRKMRSAFLTEVGDRIVANELGLKELAADDPNYAQKLASGQELRSLLREEARLTEGENDLPPELQAQRGLKKAWSSLLGRPTTSPEQERLDEVRARRDELLDIFPGADLYSEEGIPRLRYLHNALDARALFHRGEDYSVERGEVQIIDEFKGRISEGRRFTQGLHQALEIKEGVEVQPETRTIASITYPNLFRRYERVAGMTGTAKSAEKEFNEVLGLQVVDVPPNKRSQRDDFPMQIVETQQEKVKILLDMVRQQFEEGVPVLLATRSVEMNQYYSGLLESQGIPNQALNASDVKTNTPEENEIIKTAGLSGVVTVATNMAGRGVDVKPEPVNYKKLTVACQEALSLGQPVVVSLEKAEHLQRLTEWFQMHPDPEFHIPFEVLPEGATPSQESGKVQLTLDREVQPEQATLLSAENYPGKKLVVIATELNLDERIDNQLKGRAGRQGAPGETFTLISLEDELLQVYSAQDREKMVKVLRSGDQETLRKLARQAQKSAENMQAEGRFQTAKHDQVANRQREIVWGFRDHWVDSRPDRVNQADDPMDIQATLQDWMTESYQRAVDEKLGGKSRPSQERLDSALKEVGAEFGLNLQVTAGKGWQSRLDQALRSRLAELEETISSKAGNTLSPDMVRYYQWQTALQNLDEGWVGQLQALEDEKMGANLEAFAGREPDEVYVERAFKAFDGMWNWVKAETSRQVMSQLSMAADILIQREAQSR